MSVKVQNKHSILFCTFILYSAIIGGTEEGLLYGVFTFYTIDSGGGFYARYTAMF